MGTWFYRIVKAGVIATFLGIMVLGIFVAIARSEIDSFEDLKASPNGQMIRIRAADGTVIQSLGPSFGRWLTINQLPSEMKDAMVAVEDRRYYMHPGVDPIGITRSFYARAVQGRWTQGGSTITQQLARNIYLNSNKEFGRKIREIILALAMETKFSKDQILELYLNKVYFGGGAYGIDAASQKFFDHGAENISLAEAAIIAGLVKAPSRYAPTADAQAAVERAKVVVAVMQDAGMITATEAAGVKPADVKLAAESPQPPPLRSVPGPPAAVCAPGEPRDYHPHALGARERCGKPSAHGGARAHLSRRKGENPLQDLRGWGTRVKSAQEPRMQSRA